jgi:hypothetical protein
LKRNNKNGSILKILRASGKACEALTEEEGRTLGRA